MICDAIMIFIALICYGAALVAFFFAAWFAIFIVMCGIGILGRVIETTGYVLVWIGEKMGDVLQ